MSAQAAEYSSALKVRGIQNDVPGRDSTNCSTGNTDEEYLTIKNYSSSATVNLKGHLVKDATGNRFTFTANHYLQPGDYIRLRGGNGTGSDARNVVYRDNCNFLWNNDKDTIYPYKPGAARTCTPTPSAATTGTATATTATTTEARSHPPARP